MGRVRISAALCALIALTAVGTAGPAGAQTQASEVALSVEGGWLVVPVETRDGRTLRFALHTAINTTAVAASLGGDDPASLGLTFAGTSAPFSAVGTLPDETFSRGGTHVDGFLGLNMLGDVDVLLDAPNGRMLLKPIGRRVDWPEVELAEPSRMRIYHGVALRTEIEVEGHPFSATIDLAAATNSATAGVADKAGVTAETPAAVRIGSADHSLSLDIGSTPILDRWDPDGAGFVAFGSALAADCALAISYVHQELRTCIR